LNELDSKGWKNLSQEEVDEHQKLFKQLPNWLLNPIIFFCIFPLFYSF
jgi:hypothetical protein